MEVRVMSATPRPLNVISLAAGTCYGKDNVSERRVRNCYKSGHTSVLEHASITFRIEGISRACMAQLTRHRMASFCVESQRYNRYDLSGDDWYVMPEAFDTDYETSGLDNRKAFQVAMRGAAMEYEFALAKGIKPEDARYLLPEAMKTTLVMTCNVRELFHILDMRMDKAAQWEIRKMAEAMKNAAKSVSPQWCELIIMWEELHG